MDYFRMHDDYASQRTWFLGKPKFKGSGMPDVWTFTAGRSLSYDSGLIIPIQRQGDVVDITFSHYDITYIKPRIGCILEAFAGEDIQRVPAQLESGEEIEILNVLTILDCFDRDHSKATYKNGKPNMVLELRIQPQRTNDHHIFRLKDWSGPLIISKIILDHLQRIGATGFTVTKVS